MTFLRLDFESYAKLDITKVGGYRYAEHRKTEPLMLGWAFDDDRPTVTRFAEGERLPKIVRESIRDPEITKSAWNAPFEINGFRNWFDIDVDVSQWYDPMIHAYYLSLPGNLGKAGAAWGLDEDKVKDARGKALIRMFCQPQKPTKKFPHTRKTHETHPDEWEEFVEYCGQDVIAERSLSHEFARHPMPAWMWEEWQQDQEINRHGLPINLDLVRNAIEVRDAAIEDRLAELRDLTGLDNPNSRAQLLKWARKHGYQFLDLKAGHVRTAIQAAKEQGNDELHRALYLRSEVSKTSVKKYDALLAATSPETSRLRGVLQFGGAQRTFRWAGRIFQPQNLPRPTKEFDKKEQQAEAVGDLETLSPGAIDILYGKPLDLLASCIRPCVQAEKGKLFCDADLNAIENRVLGWLANDQKILDVFRKGRDPYIDFAKYMTGRTYEDLWHEYDVLKNKENRTLAKPGVLGCFEAATPVLTNAGWKAITELTSDDWLHDGLQWVRHDGVVYMGNKQVLGGSGIYATLDHKFLIGDEWKDWQQVSRQTTLRQALDTANGLLSSIEAHQEAPVKNTCVDAAAGSSEKFRAPTSSGDYPLVAPAALLRTVAPTSASESVQNCSTFSQIVSTLRERVARTLKTVPTTITAVGEFRCGSAAHLSGSNTSSIRFQQTDGLRSTELTTTGTTSEEILDSQLEACSAATCGTWDILNSGERARFVVLTDAGCLVAHNCGYMLGAGEFKVDRKTGEMVGTGLLGYAQNMGISLTPKESAHAVKTFREVYTAVVEFWYAMDKAARRCIKTGRPQKVGHLEFSMKGRFMRMRLPSGRHLHYANARISRERTPWGEIRPTVVYDGVNDKGHWGKITTHPGKWAEQSTQATSRDLLSHGMRLARDRGLNIFLHVHDQIITMEPAKKAERRLEILIECMSTVPEWAPGLILAAEGEVSHAFFKT